MFTLNASSASRWLDSGVAEAEDANLEPPPGAGAHIFNTWWQSGLHEPASFGRRPALLARLLRHH